MVLNICNFIQRTEQVPVELDISAIEEYILLLLLTLSCAYKIYMFLTPTDTTVNPIMCIYISYMFLTTTDTTVNPIMCL